MVEEKILSKVLSTNTKFTHRNKPFHVLPLVGRGNYRYVCAMIREQKHFLTIKIPCDITCCLRAFHCVSKLCFDLECFFVADMKWLSNDKVEFVFVPHFPTSPPLTRHKQSLKNLLKAFTSRPKLKFENMKGHKLVFNHNRKG